MAKYIESKYVGLATEIGLLVQEKQEAYGNAFERTAEVLDILYPNGLEGKDTVWLLTMTRIIDKLFRIATNPDAFGEDPWLDICGYALLAAQRCREDAEFREGLQEVAQQLKQSMTATSMEGLRQLAAYEAGANPYVKPAAEGDQPMTELLNKLMGSTVGGPRG